MGFTPAKPANFKDNQGRLLVFKQSDTDASKVINEVSPDNIYFLNKASPNQAGSLGSKRLPHDFKKTIVKLIHNNNEDKPGETDYIVIENGEEKLIDDQKYFTVNKITIHL
ncbi:hypothetical protein PPL_11751 [Heterostelium album PN500]|uniref:Uncharacterized protein n=1 Tax=Heterostelium pallidum (strain ATCC 26659 / Pp 5 / PN500) TaxID=670386 RepID=D3BUD2_HETP5|nr:hypothetical protein PPL_11751 [Heterostelium album PN500]EFA74720.1 hypothetical protein PPL_11751 [Heterostelium album PN500]|eukprot:XP_020426854.1 hypothetical protein PPL_11751 [Heterostelium album PN500]